MADLAGVDLGTDLGGPQVHCAALQSDSSPLADEALKKRVESLLERPRTCGARRCVRHRTDRRAWAHGNAYFTGIGRNKRIVFFDTLPSRIEAPEIEAVLSAHELGHRL